MYNVIFCFLFLSGIVLFVKGRDALSLSCSLQPSLTFSVKSRKLFRYFLTTSAWG